MYTYKYIISCNTAENRCYVIDYVPGSKVDTSNMVMRYRKFYNFEKIYHSKNLQDFSIVNTKYHEGEVDF